MSDSSPGSGPLREVPLDVALHVVEGAISCGFSAQQFDPAERRTLLEYITRHPGYTSSHEVEGYSLEACGFLPGDLLFVDALEELRDGDIVVADVEGEGITAKRVQGNRLLSVTGGAAPVLIEASSERKGVVVAHVRVHRNIRETAPAIPQRSGSPLPSHRPTIIADGWDPVAWSERDQGRRLTTDGIEEIVERMVEERWSRLEKSATAWIQSELDRLAAERATKIIERVAQLIVQDSAQVREAIATASTEALIDYLAVALPMRPDFIEGTTAGLFASLKFETVGRRSA